MHNCSRTISQARFGFWQVHQVSPQTLLPVMPHLLAELTAREDAKRAIALGTVGALLGLLDAEHALPELFSEFVRRSKDQKVHL